MTLHVYASGIFKSVIDNSMHMQCPSTHFLVTLLVSASGIFKSVIDNWTKALTENARTKIKIPSSADDSRFGDIPRAIGVI